MHVRGCHCDDCLPGAPMAGVGIVHHGELRSAPVLTKAPRVTLTRAQLNQRAYLKRKLQGAAR